MYLTPVATFHYLFFFQDIYYSFTFRYLIIFLIRMENKQICKKIIKDLHLKKIQGRKGTASTVVVVI